MYYLLIPAAQQVAVAAGSVTLMSTATGVTTTLVGAGGTIVGTATLVEIGAGGSVAAGAGAATAGLFWPITIGVAAVIGVGALAWWLLSDDDSQSDDKAIIEFSATPEDADRILRETESIIEAELGRAYREGMVELKGTSDLS